MATTSTARRSVNRRSATKRSPAARERDVIAILKDDHREVEKLFRRFDELGPRAHKTRESTVAAIISALSVHAGIEEMVLYPEIRERFDDSDDVLEALEEHHLVKHTLAELERMKSEHERFDAKVTVLMENVRHHVEEEEGELFPRVRDAFSRKELVEMGRRLNDARTLAPSRPHPHAPDVPPANIAANVLSAPLDAAVRAATGVAEKVRDVVG